MSKRWTIEEDLFLCEFHDVGADYVAQHDLGRSRGSGSARVSVLKKMGLWEKLQEYVRAKDVCRLLHEAAFSTSPISVEVAIASLEELGVEIPENVRKRQ